MKLLLTFLTLFLMLGGVASAEITLLYCNFTEAYAGLTNGTNVRINKGDDEYKTTSSPRNITLNTQYKFLDGLPTSQWSESSIRAEWKEDLKNKIVINKSYTLNRYSGELVFESRMNDQLLFIIYYKCSAKKKKKKF
jgi:hypothetical protein